VVVADAQLGLLALELQVLGLGADGGLAEEAIALADGRWAFDAQVRSDDRAGADGDVRTDDRVRADRDVGREDGIVADDCCRVDHSGRSTITLSSSASATIASPTLATPRTFTVLARRCRTSHSRIS